MTTQHYPSWAVEQVWGSDRFYNEGDVAEDQFAFVIDSGVALLDDLNVNTEWSRSFVSSEPDPHDGINSHGTAVASVIGAKANGQGLTGVAPGAQIIALKALDKGGWGKRSDIDAALTHARDVILDNNLIDRAVVNLSLGGSSPSRHPLIKELADLGIKITVSAGNSGRDADGFSPASYGDHDNVYTVSANTRNGYYSGFTNFDGLDLNGLDDVDFTAPGSDVPTYSSDGTIRGRSGTSFSAPLVAGILLMSDTVRPGQTFKLDADQVEKGMIPDPLALFDPYTYKHGERPEGPVPDGWYTPPPESIAPTSGDPIYIEVPVEVIVEKPVYIEVPGPEVIIEVPVPGPEVIIEKPVYIEVPGPTVEVPVYVEVPVEVVPDIILRGSVTESNNIQGTSLDELLLGGTAKDRLIGSSGDDILLGMGGGDRLKGGSGDDIIISGGGKAKAAGGSGSDVFVLGAGTVKIVDFDPLEDSLSYDGGLSLEFKKDKTFVSSDGDVLAILKGTIAEVPTI